MDKLETGQWAALLCVVILYPILTILLSEFQRGLERRSSPYVKSVRQFQIAVLPTAALFILLTFIAGIPVTPLAADGSPLPLGKLSAPVIFNKIVLTVAAIFLINVVLQAINAFLMSNRDGSAFLSNIPGLLLDLFRVIVVLIAAAIIVSSVWGADLQGALVGLGVGGIVLGLALQDTLSAVFAGLAMVSTRNFKEGDWIKTGDYEGCVIAMDWRSVTIETEQKIQAVVPNSELAQSTFVVESSKSMPYGEEISLFLSYDDPPEKVIAVIDDVASSISDILISPVHEVEVLNYTDKGIEYELMFFVADRGEAWRVRSDFLRRFWYAADRAGLRHMGAQNLHFQNIPRPDLSFKAKHAVLAKIDVLTPEGSGFDALVASSEQIRFGAKEIIMSAGQKFDRIYIPVEGSLSLVDLDDTIIQTIENGDFFVSRTFLSGAECPIAVRADQSCTALSIPSQDLLAYIDQNPKLATRLETYIEHMEDSLRGRRQYTDMGSFKLSVI